MYLPCLYNLKDCLSDQWEKSLPRSDPTNLHEVRQRVVEL